jgi:hypothetical protein
MTELDGPRACASSRTISNTSRNSSHSCSSSCRGPTSSAGRSTTCSPPGTLAASRFPAASAPRPDGRFSFPEASRGLAPPESGRAARSSRQTTTFGAAEARKAAGASLTVAELVLVVAELAAARRAASADGDRSESRRWTCGRSTGKAVAWTRRKNRGEEFL